MQHKYPASKRAEKKTDETFHCTDFVGFRKIAIISKY